MNFNITQTEKQMFLIESFHLTWLHTKYWYLYCMYLFSLGQTFWFCWWCICEATLLFFTKWYVSLCRMFIKSPIAMRTLYIIWICGRWRRGRERTPRLLSCCHTPCRLEIRDKLCMFSPPIWLGKKNKNVIQCENNVFVYLVIKDNWTSINTHCSLFRLPLHNNSNQYFFNPVIHKSNVKLLCWNYLKVHSLPRRRS